MKKTKKAGNLRGVVFFLAVLCVSMPFRIFISAAQEPEFRLEADSLNIKKGEGGNIVVSLIDAPDAQITGIDGLENFDVVSQSQSTYAGTARNVTTHKVDMHYTIMPKAEGQFTLKANIQYNGQNYETNELQLTVSENAGSENGASPDLFVKTVSSHEEAYLGEKIIVTYELYSRYNISSFGFTDYTSIDGVIAKDITEEQPEAEYVYIDGNKYAKYKVKQLVVDPLKSGAFTIPPFNLQVNVMLENSGIGGNFPGFGGFFQTTAPKYLQTEEKEISIKPLPTEGRPDNFSGIVGELNLEGRYSREEMNYGDSFTLSAEASGNCNLDGMKNIFNGNAPGFSLYENQKSAEEYVADNKYYVKKVFEIIFIPEKTGLLDAAPVSISYFNPVTGKYETAEIPGTKISVLGDMPQSDAGSGGQTGGIETVIINQVSYAETPDGYFIVQIRKKQLYTALIILAVLLSLSAVLLYFWRNRKKQDKTLKSVYRQIMRAADINEIYNLFNFMIKRRYNLNLKSGSKNTVRRSLADEKLAARITEIMDYVEFPESRGDTGCLHLKHKIRDVFRGNF